MTAAVADTNVTLTGLETAQLYLIHVTSVSAVNTRSTAVRLTLKTGRGQLPAGVVAACVIAGVVVVTLMIAAIPRLVRYALTCSVPVTLSHVPCECLLTVSCTAAARYQRGYPTLGLVSTGLGDPLWVQHCVCRPTEPGHPSVDGCNEYW